MSNQQEYSSLHHIDNHEAEQLCEELRQRVLQVVSRTGGHLSSNLGVVELTVAIHRVYDTQKDRLVFDVGHQCYVHKILTGRNGQMDTLRTFGGIAGFPKPSESDHDACIAGHASTSVSNALGMAIARTARGEDYKVIAVIGDGSLTGGVAYEGLSMAGQSGEPLVVVLNDNGMSITPSVGGVAKHLARQRLRPQYLRGKAIYEKIMKATPPGRVLYKIIHSLKEGVKASLLPCSMFENMGFRYMGPVDGHDVNQLTRLLKYASELNEPVLLHIKTLKGKGYLPAEINPGVYHGVGPFDLTEGVVSGRKAESFSDRAGHVLEELAESDARVCAITAAMTSGTGLFGFSQRFRDRFFDVGIAEEHAVSLAAGMAKQGMIPVFAVYSTFFQRSYDMLLHDIAISGLHAVFCVDRAGLVGDDGETHHGLFDLSFLNTVPGMTVYAPSSLEELSSMLKKAVLEETGPVAVRYPRGSEGTFRRDTSAQAASVLRSGTDITLVTFGTMVDGVLSAADKLAEQGISAQVLKLNRIVPLPVEEILPCLEKTGRVLIAEECVRMGSPAEQILSAAEQAGICLTKAEIVSCGDSFVTHGAVTQLRKLCGLDDRSLAEKALEVYKYGR